MEDRSNMKDTPELRDWVNEQVDKYYKQIGLNRLPKVCVSVDDLPHNLQCECHVKELKKYQGLALKPRKRPYILLLNLQRHKSYRELEDTIVHELMHVRFPNLNHNDEFDPSREFFTRLGMILMGKHYPKSVRKRKPKKK